MMLLLPSYSNCEAYLFECSASLCINLKVEGSMLTLDFLLFFFILCRLLNRILVFGQPTNWPDIGDRSKPRARSVVFYIFCHVVLAPCIIQIWLIESQIGWCKLIYQRQIIIFLNVSADRLSRNWPCLGRVQKFIFFIIFLTLFFGFARIGRYAYFVLSISFFFFFYLFMFATIR